MSLLRLKRIAKERGMVEYNNMKKDALIEILTEIDVEENGKNNQQLILSGVDIIARPEDQYVNASALCKAGNKKFNDWFRLARTKAYLHVFSTEAGIPASVIIERETGFSDNYKMWVHPQVAINIAQWISPEFDYHVSKWVWTLMSTGSVKIGRPLRQLMNMTETDLEAEGMEQAVNWHEFTNCCVLYVAYIGERLIKIGYSDGRFAIRDLRHQSSESSYSQWRVLKLFKISGRPIENLVHDLLSKYRVTYRKQREIYMHEGSISDFIEIVRGLLWDNDLKLRVEMLEKENMELKLEIANYGREITQN